MENELIQVVGIPDKTFKYSDIKKTVVKIQGLYYRRDSPDVIKIKDLSGKVRFFREKSPLIVKDLNGEYLLKSAAIFTEDGVWLNKQSPLVINIDSKYYRSVYCTKIDDKWYLITDPAIVKIIGEKRESTYALKTNTVQLAVDMYGTNVYAHKNNPNLVQFNDFWYLKGECTYIWSFTSNKPEYVPQHHPVAQASLLNIVYDFQDKTNPQEDRLLFINAPAKLCTPENVTKVSLIEGNTPIIIPTSLVDYFKHAAETYIQPRYISKIEIAREKINKTFSDLDEKENTAAVFKLIARPYPGKHNIFIPNYYPKPVKSKLFGLTGGLKYSFGVEFETSQGLLSPSLCDQHNILQVGDRSIGSAEYVTSPLMGNDGIHKIKEICKTLNQHTLVDDRCGIHVHVGTLFTPTEKKPTPGIKEAPTFNRAFLMNSIKLGALIEPELYAAMPKNRKPTLYHCHSIRRFGDINETNFEKYLGAYIFGPKELWYTEDGSPIEPFNFTPYTLGKKYNSNISVGTWAEGRYKWLNLIHSYSRSTHKTIEFRIFSATTVYEKVYAYIMTALAFTYIADNFGAMIKPGITLSQMFQTAYSGYPDIIEFLDTFYKERTKKFNRGELYPTNHPYLAFQ